MRLASGSRDVLPPANAIALTLLRVEVSDMKKKIVDEIETLREDSRFPAAKSTPNRNSRNKLRT